MSDHAVAAVQRIRSLLDTVAYEAEGVDDESRSVESAQLLVAIRRAVATVDVFAEQTKVTK